MELITHAAASLTRTADAIGHLLAGVPQEQAAWRPAPDQWSLLEIAAHLLDEEREDFRVRLDHTLHQPGVAWPPIDPPGWAIARRYAERDLGETLAAFGAEREQSLAWLRGLVAPDWDASYSHPKLGVIRAGDLLAAWVGHDLLHLRQLIKRNWQFLDNLADPYGLAYAGGW